MKILVTGGAGFIASNIVDAYIEAGHEVSVLDNLSTGNKANLNPKAKFYKADVRSDLTKIFSAGNFEVVNHHAAQIDVRKSVEEPSFDADVNIKGLLNVLDMCAKYKVRKIINISSGGVIYGDDARLPTKEDHRKHPMSPYGIAKLTCEYYTEFYSRIKGLKFTSLRYSNVYGPRQNPKGEAGVVAIFSLMMLEGKTPTIFGDGKQTRDYVYVGDVVRANLAALERGDGEAFNIGTSKQTNVNELYKMLREALQFGSSPNYAPARPGELQKSCLDIGKAKKLLGWKPETDFRAGIRKTVEWVKASSGPSPSSALRSSH